MSDKYYGYPYYNKPKPLSYINEQLKSRLANIENQITALKEEKERILKLLQQ